MYNIEKMSNQVAAKISSMLEYDKDYEEVLAYGAFSILQTLNTILFILVFGILFKVPLEAFVISFAASILRQYSGGVHASTSTRCVILGVFAFVGLALLVKNLITLPFMGILFLLIACLGFSYGMISKNAPKDTPNKRITDPEVKKDLRRKSLGVLHIFVLITLLLLSLYSRGIYTYGLNIILAISFGLAWQSVTLTYIGNLIVSNLDRLLGEIAYKMGG